MKYNLLQYANRFKEFDNFKDELFSIVKDKFTPFSVDKTISTYNFFLDKEKLLFQYDNFIKCWIMIVDNKVVLSKYDKDCNKYIDSDGCLGESMTGIIEGDEGVFKDTIHEIHKLQQGILEIEKQQKQGIRTIDFPKKKRLGEITRKNYNDGIDIKQDYWSLYFSQDDIPNIDKEPKIGPLTMREFYRLCKEYYLTNPKSHKEVPQTPKKAYLKFADGRMDGIDEVDLDDPKDLFDWVHKNGKWKERHQGGHPFEITARTYLYPHYTDGVNGHYVWNGFIWNHNEAKELCKEPNVLLAHRKHLVDIINEKDTLRVTPNFERHGYPNEKYSEPVRYDSLTRKQKGKIIWDELDETQTIS